jgi:hypothetical protein
MPTFMKQMILLVLGAGFVIFAIMRPVLLGVFLITVLALGFCVSAWRYRTKMKRPSETWLPRNATPIKLSDGRILIREPPLELMDRCKGSTQVQSKAQAPYIGKWLKANGRVSDICEYSSKCIVTFNYHMIREIKMEFQSTEWMDQLRVLQKGSRITVLGRIEVISFAFIALGDCELVEDGDFDSSPPPLANSRPHSDLFSAPRRRRVLFRHWLWAFRGGRISSQAGASWVFSQHRPTG